MITIKTNQGPKVKTSVDHSRSELELRQHSRAALALAQTQEALRPRSGESPPCYRGSMDLTAAFRAESPAGTGQAEGHGALEGQLEAWVARGRAAHPDLSLDPVTFVRHLARVVSRVVLEGTTPFDALHIEDLYLAAACAIGVPGSEARFETRCGARMRVVLAAVATSPDLQAEVAQEVRNVLLVRSADAPPKIASYNGQGPLDRWVAVVAQRQAASRRRDDVREQRAREGAAVEAAIAGTTQPELLYAKQRYRTEFEHAMKEAVSLLSERDRMLLRLHLISRISNDQIGRMYGVNQSTASRWLTRIREAVATEVTRILRERLGMSHEEMASLVELVASQLDISISRVLSPAEPTGNREPNGS
jgi:RNA polymerase sigma-70 factor (ECF subfamily)